MADLEKRKEHEDELAALLLMLFASEDAAFWFTSELSSQWFSRRLESLGFDAYRTKLIDQVADRWHSDIPPSVNRPDTKDRHRVRTEEVRDDLAERLRERREEWRERERQRQEDAKERNRQREADGQPLEDIEPPDLDRLYPDYMADREAATSVTGYVSETELIERDILFEEEGETRTAVWHTEPGACPLCRPLHLASETVWQTHYPKGPPAHPNCRCYLIWFPLLT